MEKIRQFSGAEKCCFTFVIYNPQDKRILFHLYSQLWRFFSSVNRFIFFYFASCCSIFILLNACYSLLSAYFFLLFIPAIPRLGKVNARVLSAVILYFSLLLCCPYACCVCLHTIIPYKTAVRYTVYRLYSILYRNSFFFIGDTRKTI